MIRLLRDFMRGLDEIDFNIRFGLYSSTPTSEFVFHVGASLSGVQ
jgi:hypothetical protein